MSSPIQNHDRWKLVLLAVLSVVLVIVLGRQAATFNKLPEAPESVKYWGEVSRHGELKVGEMAPPFCLTTRAGDRQIELSSLRDGKPVVLLFGSYTCPRFRSHANAINKLYGSYKDEAEFLLVYIKEAHPLEDGLIPENQELEPVPMPTCLAQRAEAATTCAATLSLQMPILVDNLDNQVATTYRAWPERAYVLDRSGRISYKSEVPGMVDCPAISAALQSLLQGH